MKREAKMILLFGDHRGIYIPQNFANEMDRTRVAGVSDDDYAILEAGPDHESYWDVWQDVCDYAELTDNDGEQYFIYQDGDCWGIEKGAEFNDGAPIDGIDMDWYVDDGIEEEQAE